MNVYMVKTVDCRTWEEPLPGGAGPREDYWPHALFAAERPSQAKADAFRKWSSNPYMGVYSDDYPALRARLVERDTEHQRGEVEDVRLWDRYEKMVAS